MTHPVTSRRRGVSPVLALVAVVVTLGLMPTLRTRDFYFADDSAAVFLPTWRAAGIDLLHGTWPVLRPDFWMGGNWAVEAQFGLWSPVNLAVMVAVALIPDLVVAATVVKIAFAVLLATGAYTLAREYGAGPWASVALAAALPVTGFTLYYDTATWIAGLMAFAWTPWFWWAARRCARGLLNPLVLFGVGYLLMTNGNPYGALAAVIVLAAVATEALLARDVRGLARLVVAGLAVGATAGVAYLPLVLSSEAGWRESSGLFNDGFLVPDLSMLAASSTPGAMPFIRLWSGAGSTVPLAYSAWFLLPLVPWLRWGSLAGQGRRLAGLAVVGTAYLALALGPSSLWLFRWPARLLQYVWLPTFVAFAVVLSAGVATDRRWHRAALSGGIVLAGTWLAFSAQTELPGQHLASLALHAVLVAALLAAVVVRPAWISAVMVAGTAIVLAAQLVWMPLNRDVAQWRFPSDPASLTRYAERYQGPVLQVATPDRLPSETRPDAWQWVLFGSLPGAAGLESTTSYTGIGNDEFSETLCMNHTGATCAGALDRAFAPAGGLVRVPRLVDALRVNTVVVSRALVPDAARRAVPSGWELAESNEHVTVFRRTGALAWPGSRLSATTAGVTVVSASSTATSERLVVSTGADPGALLFARLAWPGYSATVGGAPVAVVENAQGQLELPLPAGLASAEVAVTFDVPGYRVGVPLLLAALALALVQAVGWSRARAAGRVVVRKG